MGYHPMRVLSHRCTEDSVLIPVFPVSDTTFANEAVQEKLHAVVRAHNLRYCPLKISFTWTFTTDDDEDSSDN